MNENSTPEGETWNQEQALNLISFVKSSNFESDLNGFYQKQMPDINFPPESVRMKFKTFLKIPTQNKNRGFWPRMSHQI